MLFDDYFERSWNRVIPRVRKPLIAAVNGMCFGGGLELALMCDIIYASDKARFALPEVKLGLIPGSGGTVRLPLQVGKSKAMEMALSGEPISAEEALRIGLVSAVHPHDKLMDETLKLAKNLTQKSQIALAFVKRAINQAYEGGLTQAIENERNLFIGILNTDDKREGISAFINKRAPKFTDK